MKNTNKIICSSLFLKEKFQDNIRPLSQDLTNIFIVAFSVDNWQSYWNVKDKWVPEIQKFDSKIPYLIVGLKGDLYGTQKNLISQEHCFGLAKEVGACYACICSSLTQKGLMDLFDSAIKFGINRRQENKTSNKKNKCKVQ